MPEQQTIVIEPCGLILVIKDQGHVDYDCFVFNHYVGSRDNEEDARLCIIQALPRYEIAIAIPSIEQQRAVGETANTID